MSEDKKTTRERIKELNTKLAELEQEYETQLYFETMPEYDPQYTYCYTTSNRSIPYNNQSVEAWLRAVIMHMRLRRPGHGGAYSDARIVTIPMFSQASAIDRWLDYEREKLKELAVRKHKLYLSQLKAQAKKVDKKAAGK